MTERPLSATVTVLHGDNRLAISERVNAARASLDPTGLSTSIFEQASNEIADVAAAAGSPGFFGAERLVVCQNLVSAGSGSRKRRSKKKTDSDESDPLSFLSSIAPGVWVLVIEESLSSADEKRVRSFASDVSVENVSVPRGRNLIDWTCERARVHQAVIDGATATRLVEALFPGTWRQASRRDDVPPDLHRLDVELAKLAVAAGDAGEITGDLIDSLVPNAEALDIWGLTNAIADRDRARAIKQLELALNQGQAPEMILGQLTAQFETFAAVSSAAGRPNEAVASRTGLTEGRLRQAARTSRNYTRSDLRVAFEEIRRVDFGIKQGHFEPDDALVSLVGTLADRR